MHKGGMPMDDRVMEIKLEKTYKELCRIGDALWLLTDAAWILGLIVVVRGCG